MCVQYTNLKSRVNPGAGVVRGRERVLPSAGVREKAGFQVLTGAMLEGKQAEVKQQPMPPKPQ